MLRWMALLRRLNELSLPFAVPQPLSEVMTVDGVTAAAVSWIPGAVRGRGSGHAGQLARLLAALAQVDARSLSDVLDVPNAFAGREHWGRLPAQELLPRSQADVRVEARNRIAAALALPAVSPALVHGDLAIHNLQWNPGGTLCGIIDWDLACAFDLAVDAACLSWFGWSAVRSVTDTDTCGRAMVWAAVFGLEQISAAVLDHRPAVDVSVLTARIAEGLRADKKDAV